MRAVFCTKANAAQTAQIELTEESARELFALAEKHDLSHLLAYSLRENPSANTLDIPINRIILKAVYRYERMTKNYAKLCETFESAEIPFIPLKGAVIREYYPEPWMRTSCDIDFLIHPEDLDRTISALTDTLGYTMNKKYFHEISLYSPDKTHIELHTSLFKEHSANRAESVLKSVWETASVREGFSFLHEMTDEMLYFYHIAHMAKHFANGGCGVRPFVDLWILDEKVCTDRGARNKLLEQVDLLKFAETALKLSRVWLDVEEHEPLTSRMEQYVLRGGVYGSEGNQILVKQRQEGGKMKYALYHIFLPYDVIKLQYPILNKHRWLTPVMEVFRWFRVIFRGRAPRAVNKLRYIQSIPQSETDAIDNIMTELRLK